MNWITWPSLDQSQTGGNEFAEYPLEQKQGSASRAGVGNEHRVGNKWCLPWFGVGVGVKVGVGITQPYNSG